MTTQFWNLIARGSHQPHGAQSVLPAILWEKCLNILSLEPAQKKGLYTSAFHDDRSSPLHRLCHSIHPIAFRLNIHWDIAWLGLWPTSSQSLCGWGSPVSSRAGQWIINRPGLARIIMIITLWSPGSTLHGPW